MKSLTAIRDVVANKAARQIFLTQKHSPKILFVAGTIGVIGAVVLACRATMKVDDVLDEQDKVLKNDMYTDDQEQRKHEVKVKLQTAAKIARLYAPAVGLGVLSIGALTGSHVILTKRNGALAATAAGLGQAYKEYRQRVAKEYGEDVDRKFALGGETVSIEEKTAEGTIKLREGTVIKKDGTSGSPYRFLFDPVNSNKFSREPGRNAEILQMQQCYANDKLRARGHLFLNEVLDMLGLPRTKAGAVTGWVYRHDGEEKTGDNYVDFGIYQTDIERAEAFVDGAENSVWLEFNVDGPILDSF